MEATETIKMRDLENTELTKKNEEERTRLKTQQALYESVRAERNLFGKQHIEAQDEIAEMKRKHNIMSHQIEQLKEEITQKNKDLVAEHTSVKELKETMKRMKKIASDKEQILKNADLLLSNQDSEVKSLRGTLQEVRFPPSLSRFHLHTHIHAYVHHNTHSRLCICSFSHFLRILIFS
jgi:hypothetical protein